MRAPLDQSVAGYRLVKRYKKLHTPLVDLIQLIFDSIPAGMTPGETVEIVQSDGAVQVTCDIKPITLVIDDGTHKFTVQMVKTKHKRKTTSLLP